MNYLALLPVALAAGYAVGYVHGRRAGARWAAQMWMRDSVDEIIANTERIKEVLKKTTQPDPPQEKFKL